MYVTDSGNNHPYTINIVKYAINIFLKTTLGTVSTKAFRIGDNIYRNRYDFMNQLDEVIITQPSSP